MAGKNTAAVVKKFVKVPEGLDEGLSVENREVPEPADGEVRVRLLMRPVNPTDIHTIQGTRPIGPHAHLLPFVPGSEGVGKVDKNGPKTSGKLKEGQRVVAMGWPLEGKGQGTWQQYVCAPEEVLVAVPDKVNDDKIAAQYLINPFTAYGMVEDANVPQGGYLLQTAANSTLGKMVIVLAKRKGIKTINLVRREELRQELHDLGADVVINTATEDVVARVREVTGGQGAHTALDAVAGPGFKQVVSSVRNAGSVLLYGSMTQQAAEFDAVELLYTLKRIEGWLLFKWWTQLSPERQTQMKQEIWDLLADGTIKLDLGDAYPLDKVKEAVRASVKEARGAKLFLEG